MSTTAQGVDKLMLNAVATGSTTFTPRAGAARQQGFHHHIKWATGVTAGVVKIECADDSTYAGTWAIIATITNDGSGNAYEDYVFSPDQPKALRHRISTTVSGGGAPTVTTRIYGVPA